MNLLPKCQCTLALRLNVYFHADLNFIHTPCAQSKVYAYRRWKFETLLRPEMLRFLTRIFLRANFSGCRLDIDSKLLGALHTFIYFGRVKHKDPRTLATTFAGPISSCISQKFLSPNFAKNGLPKNSLFLVFWFENSSKAVFLANYFGPRSIFMFWIDSRGHFGVSSTSLASLSTFRPDSGQKSAKLANFRCPPENSPRTIFVNPRLGIFRKYFNPSPFTMVCQWSTRKSQKNAFFGNL